MRVNRRLLFVFSNISVIVAVNKPNRESHHRNLNRVVDGVQGVGTVQIGDAYAEKLKGQYSPPSCFRVVASGLALEDSGPQRPVNSKGKDNCDSGKQELHGLV